ncbi:MAG: hypothetical protein QGG48_05280 [Desulfatiglandales bacterium]|nr:hypothetical protein [Desulfatiglandales bacterium]
MKCVSKRFTIKSIFFFLILGVVAGCASSRPSYTFEQWMLGFPQGFNKQLEVAVAAEKAYHAITDTPIKELQTDRGAQRIGVLVTEARDKYRHWKSYGDYYVSRAHGGVKYDSGMVYIQGYAGKSGSFILADINWGIDDGSQPAIEGTIISSRGRAIFGGRYGDERNWIFNSPFNDILRGDRIADIPSLIGRIKR